MIFLLVLGGVSAIDSNIDDINLDNQEIETKSEIIASTNNYNGLQGYIDQASQSDVIILNQNITYNPSTDSPYSEGILINKSLTIDGDNFAINGNDIARIFKITADNVIIKNIILTKGNSTSGGAIYNVGENTTLINSTLSYNTASNQGGGIFNAGNNFSITGTNTIYNNTAMVGGAIFNVNSMNYFGMDQNENHTGANFLISGSNIFYNNLASGLGTGYGGVIYNNNAAGFTIQGNNRFENNSATESGVAGVIYNVNGHDFKIIGTNLFINNFAGSSGVIENAEGNNFIIDDQNLFSNNIANSSAGAIQNSGNNFQITGSNKFYNNSALTDLGYMNGGGAIQNNGDNFQIAGSNEFINNSAISYGGAIINYGIMSISGSNKFYNNSAGIYGGAIANEYGGNITIRNTEFKDNKANGHGTAIFNRNYESVSSTDNKITIIITRIYLYDSILEGKDYLLSNLGYLSLESNEMTSDRAPIYFQAHSNDKLKGHRNIVSDTNLIILNNTSHNALYNSTIKLTAILTDDNGNIIVGEEIELKINSWFEKSKTYNSTTGIYTIEYTTDTQGINIVTGNTTYFNNLNILNGTINVVDNEFNVESTLNGNDLTIEINFTDLTTSGNMKITIGNRTYTIEVVNGKASTTITIDSNDYQAYVEYISNGYLDSGKYTEFKNNTEIKIDVKDIELGENATITIEFASNMTIDFTIQINGNDYIINIVNGTGTKSISGLKIGNYTIIANFTGNQTHISSYKNATFEVTKIATTTSIAAPSNLNYGQAITITITINPKATGNISLYIGEQFVRTLYLINGSVTYTTTIPAGIYFIEAVYNGNENYSSSLKRQKFQVNKYNPTVTIDVNNTEYGKNTPIKVTVSSTLSDAMNGTINIFVGGKLYENLLLTNGQYILTVSDLAAGNYQIEVWYNGNEKYNEIGSSKSLTISKKAPQIITDTKSTNYGKDVSINITLVPEIEGNITISINGVNKGTFNLTNSKYTYLLNNLMPGTYNIVITYNGNENYTTVSENINIVVESDKVKLNVSTQDIIYGKDAIITVKTNETVTGEITLNIDGVLYKKAINGREVQFTITGLSAKTYVINASYSGNQIYAPVSNQTNLKVSKSNSAINITTTYNNASNTLNVEVRLNNTASGIVTITIGSESKNISLTNGKGSINFVNLNKGNYTLKAYYPGDGNYYNSSSSKQVEIAPNTILTVADIELYYRNGTKLIVYLYDSKGNPLKNTDIIVNINGVDNNRRTNELGIMEMSINLDPGNYTAITKYGLLEVKSSVKVLSTIEGSDIEKSYRNGTQYHVKILDGQGKPIVGKNVTMNINGVIYQRVTNNNGIATLSINLDPRTYIITVHHPDNNQAHSNIIKVLSTIEGQNIEKYFRNDTQYYATLYDSKGAPLANREVEMNINGVMYKRNTDSNGIVKLSINLDPNTYIITVHHPDNGQTYSNLIKVLPKLTGEDLTKQFGAAGAYLVKLVDNQGNALKDEIISININGVLYHRTTGSDGIARLNINLSYGSYIATASWSDSVTSNIIKVV
ncbi:beta strand repeat-containing protein [Methanobrevibacter sp. DSM 116169]|uniref:beta strand repeat-containing protein n=1 Tax=Methanobrevibacter sp. DSM 116169 TaxID=3242727 RepID=UPI0038FC79D7